MTSARRPDRPIKLYSASISGHSHRVRLFLALLGLPFETVEVDLAARAQRSPEFLRRNAFGQVPVIAPFLAGPDATLADIANYSYVAHAPEGNVSLEPYAQVRAWLRRIEALPGFVPMVRSPVGLAAA